VLLGKRGDASPAQAGGCSAQVARCLAVWLGGTTALASAALAAGPAADQAATRAWTARASLDLVPLDRALADLCAVLLLGSLAWGWLALTVTVVEALSLVDRARLRPPGARPPDPRRPALPWHLPGPARRLVLAACGVALVAGLQQPALAASGLHDRHHHPHPHPHLERVAALLDGLPLPERAVARARTGRSGHISASRRSAPHTVVVLAGDCLWSIAVADLPAGASPREVATRWQAIYAANHDVIGPDPDHLLPGQRLTLPALRKDP
jgi:nucleoid-associated protein YgaU